MKKNIERVFKNLLLISILLTLILAITATVSYNEESNYDMIQSIQKQRVLIDEINELNIEDNQLNSIITRE
ncbi:MAG: hypothetical protein U9N42_01165, partial [Campylobacterota bacterium]|nr:hypothetical protein [Campylobacterota bacterium]